MLHMTRKCGQESALVGWFSALSSQPSAFVIPHFDFVITFPPSHLQLSYLVGLADTFNSAPQALQPC